MPKRCPTGVICIENMTIIFLIIIVFLAGFVYYKFATNSNRKQIVVVNSARNSLVPKYNSVFSTLPTNILMNPFAPPLKNGNYFSLTKIST